MVMKENIILFLLLSGFTGATGLIKATATDDLFKAVDNKNLPAVQSALKAGADVNAKDKLERTPLIIAIYWNEKAIVQELLAAKGIDVNKAGRFGLLPLVQAAAYGLTDIVKLLLATEGIDRNAKDSYGRTALDAAKKYERADTVQLLQAAGAK
jgi:uncharacterized protein